jgi:acetolactate synthase-1/2/3 large subunit
VHQQQDLFYGQRVFASDFRQQVDFVTIAKGFGMTAYDLSDSKDPVGMLAQAITTDGPCLIHAPIDVNEKVYPMVPPGAANKDMIGNESPAGLALNV